MISNDDQRPSSIFERNPKWAGAVIVVVFLCILEGISYIVLIAFSVETVKYPYNRIISGYYVYKSTPGYRFNAIKNDPQHPEVNLDKYGFYSDSPISLEKPSGVVRIFLVGGSSALGAGQHSLYTDVHNYPKGVFSYPISISGYLKKYLDQHLQPLKFEVITAATHNRVLHQSFLLYLEKISKFSPDYVINVDGFNDVFTFVNGNPYENVEEELPNYINLYAENTWPTMLQQLHIYQLGVKIFIKIKSKIGITKSSRKNSVQYDHSRYTEDDYLRHRNKFIENTDRFLQILTQYMAVLRADDVQFIFTLQPILHRQINKALSKIENSMVKTHFPRWHTDLASFEQANLVYKFFFDDYLSSEIEKHILNNGHRYLDSNLAIRNLDAISEFYTDYAHLTPEGNQFIAELIGQEITRNYQQTTRK